MKNLKPSELPVDTVIKGGPPDQYDELYIKKEGGVWEDLFSGCGCCQSSERISDAGCEEDDLYYEPHKLTTTKKSDDYFEEGFKVIASDPEFDFEGVMLHGPWVEECGTFADDTPTHYCKGYNCEA